MYGTHISTLSVYVRSGSHDTFLWSKAGTHGDKWLQAVVTVNSRTHFQVRLKIFGKKKILKKKYIYTDLQCQGIGHGNGERGVIICLYNSVTVH